MMELICHSPVAVVDSTTNNPNVFYELGVATRIAQEGYGLDPPQGQRRRQGFSGMVSAPHHGQTWELTARQRNGLDRTSERRTGIG
jgi:hypothetical protein